MIPDELALYVANPDGTQERAAGDELSFPLADYTLTSSLPGGFATADAIAFQITEGSKALHRFAPVSLRGPDRTLAWEGRIESTPIRSDERELRVACIGHRALLADVCHVVFLGVDNDLSSWEDVPRARREYLAGVASGHSVNAAFNLSIDDGSITLTMEADHNVQSTAQGEAWYRAPASQLVAEIQYIASEAQGTDMDPVLGSTELPGQGLTETTTPTMDAAVHSWTPSEARRYVVLKDQPTTEVNKTARALHLHAASLYGDHDLPRVAISGAADGLLFSDILRYLLALYAPQIATSVGGEQTISDSSFAMPSAVWPEPSTLVQVMDDGMAFERNRAWAVWEGPALHWRDRRNSGVTWHLRRQDGARFVDSGETAEPDYNGVIVTYTTEHGMTRWVGPPGSGADTEDATLADSDPENPANLAGLTRYLPVSLDTTSAEKAIEVGELALKEALKTRFAGEVEAPRYAEREGQVAPTWMMRAGDRVVDADMPGAEEMLLVETSYTRSAERQQTASVEQPANRLDAAIAGMGATIHKRNRRILRRDRRLKGRHQRQRQRQRRQRQRR